ncbi:TPA: thymidylate synthase, partial [Candidatus Woesearchaeota archaeon]|nr:thymidylate synthase [Candidatus Woesearchaeota archaeon]
MFKPVFKGNMLTIGVSESPLAIVTLWSDKNLVAASLKPEHYGVIGQLYSSTRGLDPIVRNLLANTHIRYLIVYGNDLSGSGAVLRDFFKKGFEKGRDSVGNECWRVRSDKDGFIDIEVTEQALQLLRDNVTLIGAKSLDELLEYAKRLSAKKGTPYSQPMFFEKKPREAATIKGEDSAFRVSGKKVAEVWVKLLDIIMKFGRVSPTHYDSRMKEVVDLISVVTDEDPEGMCVPDFLPCNEKMLEEYFPTVLSSQPLAEIKYTYGQRLRAHFGVDQVEAMIKKLSEEKGIRSAVAVLWDPRIDNKKGGMPGLSPCLNYIGVKISGDKLILTALIRSNDMFSGWPENAFVLRKLQELIRGGVEKRGN